MTEQVLGTDSAFTPEKLDIQPVPDNIKGPDARSLFYIWFASNLTIGDFALGFLPIFFGFGLVTTIIALIVGNVIGASMLGLMSAVGPKSRVPQMVMGRRSFGNRGGSIMSVLQWLNTTGWLTINTVLAAFALSLLISGTLLIYSVILVAAIVGISAYFGQKFIHKFEKLMSYLLGIMFIVVTYFALDHLHWTLAYSSNSNLSMFTQFGIVLALSFSYIMSWGPYASDYSRYIAPDTSMSRVFSYSFLGGFAASLWLEIAGMLVAIASGMAATANPASALAPIMGRYFDIGLVGIVLGGIAANSINLYSNSLSIRAAGLKLKRITVVIIMSVVAVIFSLISVVNGFNYSYETFLYLLDYWITPWIGIILADFFIVNRGKRYGQTSNAKYNLTGIVSYCASIIISIPFMAPSGFPYGPVAQALGGVDLSYYVSFVLAMVLYVVMNRISPRMHKKAAAIINVN
ncbi:MAG: hypothetical protein B2I17_06585 [Thermoplasmatales archaeon B_DKE]|nr:MAG: hypothetical protein B2I17_06585 [Thermoplasmatales archaeon B_DKE]